MSQTKKGVTAHCRTISCFYWSMTHLGPPRGWTRFDCPVRTSGSVPTVVRGRRLAYWSNCPICRSATGPNRWEWSWNCGLGPLNYTAWKHEIASCRYLSTKGRNAVAHPSPSTLCGGMVLDKVLLVERREWWPLPWEPNVFLTGKRDSTWRLWVSFASLYFPRL